MKKNLLSFFSPKTQRTLKKDEIENVCPQTENSSEIPKPNFLKSLKRRASLLESDEELTPKKLAFTQPIQSEVTNDITLTNTSLNLESFRLNTQDNNFKNFKNELKEPTHIISDEIGYLHHSYDFLRPEHRRDISGRPLNDPDFDNSSLMLPAGFLSSKEITPAMKQWWRIKMENFDSVLFFKMGKFYELFHMDADVGVKELGLTYMKGKYAHAGFPETSFAVHATALVEKGYKVARVEQTEKPSDVTARLKDDKGGDKLVRRDLCNIVSSGTRIFDSFDLEGCSDRPESSGGSTGFGYLLSIVEEYQSKNSFKFGVCLLDCSLSTFTLAYLEDDRSLSRLRTMLAHFSAPVAEVVFGKGGIMPPLELKLKTCVNNAKFERLNIICDSKFAIKEILSKNYFSSDETAFSNWPEVLKTIARDESSSKEAQLQLISVGIMLFKLKKHLIDEQVFSVGTFKQYNPLSLEKSNSILKMIIDDNALRNLDVVVNSEGFTGKYGTILSLVNHCGTGGGKRLMVNLVCHPLRCKKDIDDRLDAVEEFLALNTTTFSEFRRDFNAIPDLERLLFRLSSVKTLFHSPNHPQNNAILFNESFFNKKKVDDLIMTLSGFIKAFSLYHRLMEFKFTSPQLKSLFTFDQKEEGSDLKSVVDFFSNLTESFDLDKATNQGVVLPYRGFIPEYDSQLDKISTIEDELQRYLEELKIKLKCNSLKYWGSDRSRYLIEIPISVALSQLPDNFELKSQRKGFKRYSSPTCQSLLSKLIIAEDCLNLALRNVFVLLIEKILTQKKTLLDFLEKLSMIDCLMSFAFFSSGCVTNGFLSRPNIVESEYPFFEVIESYHPCLSLVKTDVVSNDLSIGTQKQDFRTTLLITGPNMGGKSTLMRQVAITVILAQIGCYVPCTFCQMTPVDRIFARLGASFDHPVIGESTFYVELAETSVMTKTATRSSLLLLDELGRGTATHDGLAIAYSTLKYITQNIGCLTMFSTHYHYIGRDIISVSSIPVEMVYMECQVNEDETSSTQDGKITFLYKVKSGVCPKSYGFHVARLAGLPETVINRGISIAKKMEKISLLNELIQAKITSKEDSYRKICTELSKF